MAQADGLIYLDHAATTPIRPEVLAAMLPHLQSGWANPSSNYEPGRAARGALEDARANVADCLGAQPAEIVFTGGGSESNNLAIKGVASAAGPGRHIVTTAIEHHAVLHACQYLEARQGYTVSYLPVDGQGLVDPEGVAAAITPNTVIVSVMLANNEVGTIEPVVEIGGLLRPRGVLLHTDAVQAVGMLPVDVGDLNVDLLTISAHKFGGPKGVGALYVRRGTAVDALVHGGGQEFGLRAGTESVAQAVGLATALRLAVSEREARAVALQALRNRLIAGVLATVPDAFLTGHPERRLPGNASFCFPKVEGETVLIELDARGICASAGSACSAGSTEPSHVLQAMQIPAAYIRGALRLTLGADNTEAQVDEVIYALATILEDLHALAA
ncbi:MAG TPA: cysteine desulfurase family protein [Chloroflexota bacterium]|jgi:cysteine desulfurase|nr:cysteine desulfurase family protein [Chloroflexota bacterium]